MVERECIDEPLKEKMKRSDRSRSIASSFHLIFSFIRSSSSIHSLHHLGDESSAVARSRAGSWWAHSGFKNSQMMDLVLAIRFLLFFHLLSNKWEREKKIQRIMPDKISHFPKSFLSLGPAYYKERKETAGPSRERRFERKMSTWRMNHNFLFFSLMKRKVVTAKW